MSMIERLPLTAVAHAVSPGRPLPFRILDAGGRLLLAQGQTLLNESQLETLVERGACVLKEEAEAWRKGQRLAAQGSGAGPAVERALTWFDRREHLIWSLDALLRRLGKGEVALEGAITALADELIGLIERQPDAALFMCIRQEDHRFALYALTHALHSATFAWLTARQIGWPPELQRTLVRAALTMNASIAELQAQMAEQSEPPSKGQIERIRAHPLRSEQMLMSCGVTDPVWLGLVRDHHERIGADGYPNGKGDPGEPARLLRAADVFTAKVSPRAIRVALPPQQAARELFQQEGGGPIAAALIKAVGIYPPGDFVRLKSGEAAVVLHRPSDSGAAVAVALLSPTGKRLSTTPHRNTAEPEYAIAGPLTDRAAIPRLLPEALYGLLM